MIDDEAARWYGFAALLPPVQAQEFRDCWDIGEQEAGLDRLVAGLLEHRVPISGTTRAEIAVTAEEWGVREAIEPGLGRCLDDGGRGEDGRGPDGGLGDGLDGGSLSIVDPAGGLPSPVPSPVPPPGSPPGPPTGPAGPDAELLVVPWISCTRCGRTLARTHEREPWGGLSYLARSYVVFAPGGSVPERSFPREAAWEALTALRVTCAR
ncbi:hypothetical protein ABZY68_31620 [Streptomyces sp. NPDC006482]|uniref:hypothetical protein n=1 Tax=Streptomyces sp. NPDC006482 TaxID=3154306 RepID=UPI0033BB5F1B